MGNQLGCREIRGGHDLALVKIELEAKAAAALLHMAKGSSYCVQVACQDPIVKVEGCEVKAALELLGQGLQRDSEEQGSQGVSLLNSSSRVDDSVAKLKMRGRAIAPCHPTGKLWEVGAGVVERILP